MCFFLALYFGPSPKTGIKKYVNLFRHVVVILDGCFVLDKMLRCIVTTATGLSLSL